MEIFCKDLKHQTDKIVKYERKEIIPLTEEETESYENQKVCYISKKEFITDKNSENEFKMQNTKRNSCSIS